MPLVVIDVVLFILVAATGVLAGWWLRNGDVRLSLRRVDVERQNARRVLARLYDLATCMTSDVGAHSTRVEEINEELASGKIDGSEVVIAAVADLIQANQKMQQQLSAAKETLQRQSQEIEWHSAQALVDPLTGLANRRAFDSEIAHRAAEFQRHGRAFSLISIDVDCFKRINDAHGHQAGDEVLRGLAGSLCENAREMDIVARYGGEEFGIVLPATPIADAKAAAERTRRQIEDTRFHFAGTDLHVTVSMGVAESLPNEDTSAILARADAALYASKRAGRNCVHWHDGQKIHSCCSSERSPVPDCSVEHCETEQPQAEIEVSVSDGPQSEVDQSKTDRSQSQSESALQLAVARSSASSVLRDYHRHRLHDRVGFSMILDCRLADCRCGGGQQPSVFLVQIDDYPAIVSCHGQQAAKAVVRATRQFVNTVIEDGDAVGQFDVATFAVLLSGSGLADVIAATERLKRLIACFASPADNGQLQFTASMGGAEATPDDDTEELLSRTEEALNAAITSGGNCRCFHNGKQLELITADFQRAKPGIIR